jgi:hypothetical protein
MKVRESYVPIEVLIPTPVRGSGGWAGKKFALRCKEEKIAPLTLRNFPKSFTLPSAHKSNYTKINKKSAKAFVVRSQHPTHCKMKHLTAFN